jgi:hypothetical protein
LFPPLSLRRNAPALQGRRTLFAELRAATRQQLFRRIIFDH